MNAFWADPANREQARKDSARIWSDKVRRQRQRECQKELWSDPERVAQHTERIKQLWQDPEHKERMAHIYRDASHRAKVSNAVKEQWANPEIRARKMAVLTSPEYRAKQARNMIERYTDPAWRQRASEYGKAIWADPERKAQLLGRRIYRWNSDWCTVYPDTFNDALKEAIRERDGRVCFLCGISEIELGRRLYVHHIDYDKANINPENLISLCGQCHTKTNRKRDHWMSVFSVLLRPRRQDWQHYWLNGRRR